MNVGAINWKTTERRAGLGEKINELSLGYKKFDVPENMHIEVPADTYLYRISSVPKYMYVCVYLVIPLRFDEKHYEFEAPGRETR